MRTCLWLLGLLGAVAVHAEAPVLHPYTATYAATLAPFLRREVDALMADWN